MHIVSAREFRANQSAVLKKVLAGESVLLNSRLGTFKILPVTEDDSLTKRICNSLDEVKQIRENKLKGYSVDELLNELKI